MTGDPTPEPDVPPAASPTDAASLAERDDVDVREHTFTHEGTDHCEADARGRAIVGVVRDDGALLVREHEDGPLPVLPNGLVEDGEDWATVAREVGEAAAGSPVEIDAPVRVRHVEHGFEGDAPAEETTHVVFRARPVDGDVAAPPSSPDSPWTSRWRDAFPDELADDDGNPTVEDLLLFVE